MPKRRQLEVSTPELRDDYVTRKASLDKLVDEFLEGSSLHLNQTGSLISLELFENPATSAANISQQTQHQQQALTIHASSSDARLTVSGISIDFLRKTERQIIYLNLSIYVNFYI